MLNLLVFLLIFMCNKVALKGLYLIMKLIFTILTLLFSSVVHAQQNILLIIADDYGADFSSVYTAGNHIPPTPTIQGLSDNGVKFERAWAQPSCAPTRATILTGRYGFRTGVGVPGDIVSLMIMITLMI